MRQALLTADKETEFSSQVGQIEKDAGLAKVSAHNSEFLRLMRIEAARLTRECHRVTIDDLRRYGEFRDIQPFNPHAWGAIVKCKGFRCIGRERSALITNHGRSICVWHYTPELKDIT